MGVLQFTGNLQAGPSCGGWGVFPSSSFNDQVGVGGPCGKSFGVSVSSVSANINSPSSFTAIPGVGTEVTNADTLYFRTNSPITLQLTCSNGSGGTTVSTVNVNGLFVCEFSETNALQGLAVEGVAQITYFVSGLS